MNKCEYRVNDTRLSGFAPSNEHPESCYGCGNLKRKSGTTTDWYCKGKGIIWSMPFPDMRTMKAWKKDK